MLQRSSASRSTSSLATTPLFRVTRRHSVTVYRSFEDIPILAEKDTLSGESVVPGFECKMVELFAGLN